MKAIRFTLESEFAIFKNADTRNGKGRHFTYNHIHRLSVLGILGCIMGLEGYNIHHLRKTLGLETTFFPEYYEALKDAKISIVPNVEFDSFAKQFSEFTDTTTYSNQDGTLMVREQWLRKPSWDIYILLDNSLNSETEEKLEDYLLNQKCVYIPYLGKNDHPAVIKNVEMVELEVGNEIGKIDSLFELDSSTEEEIKEQENEEDVNYYLFEFMPVHLGHETGNYVLKKMAYTDAAVELSHFCDEIKHRKLIFM